MNRGGRCLSLCGNRQLGFRAGERLEAAGFYDRTFEAVRFFATPTASDGPGCSHLADNTSHVFSYISTPSLGLPEVFRAEFRISEACQLTAISPWNAGHGSHLAGLLASRSLGAAPRCVSGSPIPLGATVRYRSGR